jgi:DNA-binding NtrC family response regulator
MSRPGGTIEPEHLSPDLTAVPSTSGIPATPKAVRAASVRNLASAVEEIERELIGSALKKTSGNISETARVLGLTRRGLYLKMRRLGLDDAPADT